MDLNLKDKAVIVTGGGRGFGVAIARAFYRADARVAVLDVDGKTVNATARSLDPTGKNVIASVADVTVESQVLAAVDQVVEHFGRIDVLVNNAGILKHLPIEELSVADFEQVVKVNLTGTFIACKAVVPVMKKQGKGKIINISSLGGRTGRPGVGVNYAAAKAGIIGLTQTLAREAGPSGIYVNAIAPGPILTELTRQSPKEVFAAWNAGRAVNKDGLPEDVADAVMFLASDKSDWVTGATLDVNGGILMR